MNYLLRQSVFLLLCSLLSTTVCADQYRSKVLLDPNKQLNKSVELTLDELEQQFDQIDDSYSKSSAGRHLARHYLKNGEYDKAANFYETALQAEGLSAIANQEMLKELASVYLLNGDYKKAISTIEHLMVVGGEQDNDVLLILAQAHYKIGDHLAVADSLDLLMVKVNELGIKQLKQVLALYYKSGNYSKCEKVLNTLLYRQPQNIEVWRQLTSIYLKQNKRKQALNQLSLAYEKRLPLGEQDLLLLVDLYMANNSAFKAARLLQQAISDGDIKANGANYKRLFENWLQARDRKQATKALQQAAKLTGDILLYLHLAQLQMEQQSWQAMNNTIRTACKKTLPDKYVSRANLYLGISELKLGHLDSARAALIDATLIGGSVKSANRWLMFIQAAPAEAAELRKINGICHPENRRVRFSGVDAWPSNQKQESKSSVEMLEADKASGRAQLEIKTIKAQRIYYKAYDMPTSEISKNIKSLGLRLGITLIKNGGSMQGNQLIIYENVFALAEGQAKFKLAIPTSGTPQNKSGYKLYKTKSFKCAVMTYSGSPEGLRQAWKTLLDSASEAGYALTGEARQVVIQKGSGDGTVNFELQAGVQD